jgi:mono/diheme cytochrome c family protein
LRKGCVVLTILVCGAWLLNGLATSTSPKEGEDLENGRTLYFQYCASCHGNDASGNGASAAKLKVVPPSLKNLNEPDGKFPEMRVQNIISGFVSDSARKSRVMPEFEKYFQQTKGKSLATLNIYALTTYLKAFQPKPAAGSF